jgi:cysteine-rich repeat protein
VFAFLSATAAASCSGPPPPAPPVCGDGQVNGSNEVCDDGNAASGDGCNAACRAEYIVAVRLDGARSDSTVASWSYQGRNVYYVTESGRFHTVPVDFETRTPLAPPTQTDEGVRVNTGGSRWSRPSIFSGGAFVFEEFDGEWVAQWLDTETGSVRRTIRTGGSLPVSHPFLNLDETTVVVKWSTADIVDAEPEATQHAMSAAGLSLSDGYYAAFQGIDQAGRYNTAVVTDLESGRTRPLANDDGVLWRTATAGVIAVTEPHPEATFSARRRRTTRSASRRPNTADVPRLVWVALGAPVSAIANEPLPISSVPERDHPVDAYQPGQSWSGTSQAAWRDRGSDSLWGLSRLGGGSVTLVRLLRTAGENGGTLAIAEEAIATLDGGREALLLCVAESAKRALVRNQSTILHIDLETRRVTSMELQVPEEMVLLGARADDDCASVAYMVAPSGGDATECEVRIISDLASRLRP